MLWVYGNYKYFTILARSQILSSKVCPQRWNYVADNEPTSNQHWVNMPCSQRHRFAIFFVMFSALPIYSHVIIPVSIIGAVEPAMFIWGRMAGSLFWGEMCLNVCVRTSLSPLSPSVVTSKQTWNLCCSEITTRRPRKRNGRNRAPKDVLCSRLVPSHLF